MCTYKKKIDIDSKFSPRTFCVQRNRIQCWVHCSTNLLHQNVVTLILLKVKLKNNCLKQIKLQTRNMSATTRFPGVSNHIQRENKMRDFATQHSKSWWKECSKKCTCYPVKQFIFCSRKSQNVILALSNAVKNCVKRSSRHIRLLRKSIPAKIAAKIAQQRTHLKMATE